MDFIVSSGTKRSRVWLTFMIGFWAVPFGKSGNGTNSKMVNYEVSDNIY